MSCCVMVMHDLCLLDIAKLLSTVMSGHIRSPTDSLILDIVRLLIFFFCQLEDYKILLPSFMVVCS